MDQVTIFGESAGGTSVCFLLSSPAAKGLFKRGIIESGPCNGPWGIRNLQPYDASAAWLATIGNPSLDDLRSYDGETLMKTLGGSMMGIISYDNYVFSDSILPPERFTNGEINVDPEGGIIIGSNTVDSLMMPPWDTISNVSMPVTEEAYERGIR